MNKIKVGKFLSSKGYGSRKEIKQAIKNKLIKEDDALVKDFNCLVNPKKVFVRGQEVMFYDKINIVINKPKGYVCARAGDDSIFKLLPDIWLNRKPKVNTVGRLDKDTSGMLIITDDGLFLHKIISPKHKISKVYKVKLEKKIGAKEKQIFESGGLIIEDEDKPCKPVLFNQIDSFNVILTMYEGKYHQIKKMFTVFGNKVIELSRIQLGSLQIRNLKIGKWRELNEEDMKLIFKD